MKVLKDIVLGTMLAVQMGQLPFELKEGNMIMQYSLIDEASRGIHRRVHIDEVSGKRIRCLAEYDLSAEQRAAKTIIQYINPRYYCDEIPQ